MTTVSRLSALFRRSCSLHRSARTAALSTQAATTVEPERVRLLKLNNLYDNPGAVKKKKRVGRGVGSGRGKTCGRGHKGQKARSGHGIPIDFMGGQTKFWRRLPKHGFRNPHAQPLTPVNLGKIQDFIDMERIDPTQTITLKAIVEAGIMKATNIKYGVKLLADGKDRLRTPNLDFLVSRASASAIEAVEANQGVVTTIHYNRLALRAHLKPHKFPEGIPKMARPPPKLMLYYRNYKNRGYLSPQMQLRKLEKRLGLPLTEFNYVDGLVGEIDSSDADEAEQDEWEDGEDATAEAEGDGKKD